MALVGIPLCGLHKANFHEGATKDTKFCRPSHVAEEWLDLPEKYYLAINEVSNVLCKLIYQFDISYEDVF